MNTLNVTIGPVQGFVVQARRTRDLWSGSFLLSYLSGCAMVGAEKASGQKISEPDISNNALINLIRTDGNLEIEKRDLLGSLPNRFKIECENPEKVAHDAKQYFDKAWNRIADAVWDEYLKDVKTGNGTRAIWDRQLNKFWEFSWTVGDQKMMDARKNWRRQDVPEEGGDHCTLMGDKQELSGFIRFRHKKEQDGFWEAIRRKSGKLDLNQDERLCTIAFIKRFFPKVSKKAIGIELGTTHWPSTVYMAAVPWLKGLDEKKRDLLDDHYAMASKCGKDVMRPDIPKMMGLEGIGKYAQLDGNLFFKDLLRSDKATPLNETPDCSRIDLLKSLANLEHSPSVYYALLLMDGDSLGKKKKENPDKTTEISRALSDFGGAVPNIVREHNGVTIYAGGDDVLAMLPMDTAMSCANNLYDQYVTSFNGIGINDTTVSAGLVYSHYHQPLQSVYNEAHHILDDVAKDGNGRDSIAVSVLKGSGKYLQWVSKWDMMGTFNNALKEYDDEKTFSSSLLYSVRESLSLLTNVHDWQPGKEMDIVMFDSELDLQSLIVADMVRSRDDNIDRKTAKNAVERLEPILQLCYRDGKSKFLIDGWFLVRFLSGKGGE